MEMPVARPDESVPGPRPRLNLELELEIGRRIEGYRWVEWNPKSQLEMPIHQPGRFIGHPGDLLARFYITASPGSPPAPEAYALLPRYTSEAAAALRAAERAGLFSGEGAKVRCDPTGRWRVVIERADIDMEDEVLPRLLCRATLGLLAHEHAGEET